MPLINLYTIMPERRSPERLAADSESVDSDSSGVIQVVVCTKDNKAMGLVVDQIIDVADEVVEISGESSREGVSATAVIQDRVTEFLDIDAVLRMHSGKANRRGNRTGAEV